MSAVRSRLSVADSGLRMTYAELAVFTRQDEVLPKDQAVKRQTAGDCYSSVFTKTKSESINSRARNGLCLVGPLAREALQTLPEHHGLLPQLLVALCNDGKILLLKIIFTYLIEHRKLVELMPN